MAHTIFHSPDRQDIIRRRTPRVTIEAARNRRVAARRAVLGRFQRIDTPKAPTTPLSGTTGRSDSSRDTGGGGRTAGDITGSGQIQRNINALDALKLSFAPSKVGAFAQEAISRLAPLNLALGIFGGPMATLASNLSTLSSTGSQVDAFGTTFRGTDYGIVNQQRLTRELSGGSMGESEMSGSAPTGSFSPTFGVDTFGQISGPQSSIAGGVPGSLESMVSESTISGDSSTSRSDDSGFTGGGFAGGDSFGGGNDDNDGGSSAGGTGGVGEGGGIGL